LSGLSKGVIPSWPKHLGGRWKEVEMMRSWKLAAVVVGVLILGLWAGCSNPNLAGGKLHFDQASKLEGPDRTARFERARQTFAQACREMPKNGEPRFWLAQTYAELDKPDSAGMNFDLAAELTPAMKEDVQKARDHYWSVKHNSGLVSAKSAMEAKAAGKEGEAAADFRDALAQFQKAVLYSPNHAETCTFIGKVYLNLGVLDSAVVMLRKAQSISPDNENIKKDLFGVYKNTGDKDYAKGQDLMTATDSLGARAKFESAMRLYGEADAVIPGQADLNFQMGATSYELSNLDRDKKSTYLDDAIRRYQEVLKDNPADVDVLFNLTLVLRDLGRNEEAEKLALRLVDIDPKEHTYRETLGRIQDKLNNKQGLVTGLIIGKALKDGTPLNPSEAPSRADKFGAGNDLRRRYLESGAPDEILTFTDSQGQDYDVWFYWTRGVGYGFVQGKEKYTTQFAPFGVLTVTKAEIGTKGSSKVVLGTLSNGSSRKFDYARAELTLLDETGAELGRVTTSTQKLDAHGTYSFEIPLTGDNEKALEVKPQSVVGY
jgi:tetratricopeptide (TPR) repeat protein